MLFLGICLAQIRAGSIPSLWALSVMTINTPANVSTNTPGAGTITALTQDSQGNLYSCGFYRGTLSFGGLNLYNTNNQAFIFCSRNNSGGNPVWLTNSTATLTPISMLPTPDDGITLFTYFHGPMTNKFGNSTFTSAADWGALIMSINSNGVAVQSMRIEAYGTNMTFITDTNDIGPQFDITGAQYDQGGNLYLSGDFMGTLNIAGIILTNSYGINDQDYYLAKFDKNGIVQWARQGGSPRADQIFNLVLDQQTNIFIIGIFGGTNVFNGVSMAAPQKDGDGFLMKLNSDGTIIWIKQSSDVVSGYSRDFHSVCSDGIGGCYVCGSMSPQDDTDGSYPSYFNAFITHLDSLGNVQWTTPLTATNGTVYAKLAGVDTNGNIYIFGNFNKPTSFGNQLSLFPTNIDSNFIVGRLTPTGSFQWAKMLVAMSIDEFAFETTGNTYAAGRFNNMDALGGTNLTTYGSSDAFVTKVNNSGQSLWTMQIGGSQNCLVRNILSDNKGGLYLTCLFNGTNHIQNNSIFGNAAMQTYLTHIVDTPTTPQILQVKPEGVNARLYWQGGGGFSYVVQSATNLSGTNVFTDLSPVVTVPGYALVGTNYLHVGAITNAPTRFYRIRSN